MKGQRGTKRRTKKELSLINEVAVRSLKTGLEETLTLRNFN